MQFVERAPSIAWEQISLAGDAGAYLWAWFRPPAAPQGVFLRVPPELYSDPRRRPFLTIRGLIRSLGVDPQQVTMWSLYGTLYDAQLLANPAWDFPLPEPGAVPDPSIGVYLRLPVIAPPIPVPPAATAAAGGTAEQVFARMEADWQVSLQIELQVDAAAKQLNATLLRLAALNRDMSPEENRGADSQDKRDWQEARRWLRDVSGRCSRYLKEHTVGMTSNAGKRQSYLEIYQQYVVPRRPYEGLAQAERDFEAYRKNLQTLLGNLTTGNSTAIQDGERRAQQVMTRVAAKVRTQRSKRGS